MGNKTGTLGGKFDEIAAKYILEHPDPKKFTDLKYCNDILFLTIGAIKTANGMEAKKEDKTCPENITTDATPEALSTFYLKVANLFSVIITILNPVYPENKKFKTVDFKKILSRDSSNNIQAITFYNLWEARIDATIMYYCKLNNPKTGGGIEDDKVNPYDKVKPVDDKVNPDEKVKPDDKVNPDEKVKPDEKVSQNDKKPKVDTKLKELSESVRSILATDKKKWDMFAEIKKTINPDTNNIINTEKDNITEKSKDACIISYKLNESEKIKEIKEKIKKQENKLLEILNILFKSYDDKKPINNTTGNIYINTYALINTEKTPNIDTLITDATSIITTMYSEFEENLFVQTLNTIEADIAKNVAKSDISVLDALQNPDVNSTEDIIGVNNLAAKVILQEESLAALKFNT